MVRFYQENGPSLVGDSVLFDPNNSFGLEGYLAMLIGQAVPHAKPWQPPAAERAVWRTRLENYAAHAAQGYSVAECLALIREGRIQLG